MDSEITSSTWLYRNLAIFTIQVVKEQKIMTGGQQNIHKYIWLGIAFIVPILIFMALRNRYDNPESLDYSPIRAVLTRH